MKETLQNLDKDIRELIGQVKDSRKELNETNILANKLKLALRIIAVLVGVAFLSMSYMGYSIYENKHNATVQCENQNETREAFRFVFDFILGAELKDPENNPRENTMAKLILPYIHKTWAERDCTNLGKEYPEAKKPELPKNYSTKGSLNNG